MKIRSCLSQQLARTLVCCLLASCAQTGWPQQAENTAPGVSQPQTGTPAPEPGTNQTTSPPQSSSPGDADQGSLQPAPQAQAGTQSPAGTQEPVGTAAAPYEKVTGVPASRPAGAAIAPAKQRRARSILIKVGIIVAAGVAIGTVIALSNGSSSKPH